jgi:hypothetical protein
MTRDYVSLIKGLGTERVKREKNSETCLGVAGMTCRLDLYDIQ